MILRRIFSEEAFRDVYDEISESNEDFIKDEVEVWWKNNEKEIVAATRNNDFSQAARLTDKLNAKIAENFQLPSLLRGYIAFGFLFGPPAFRSTLIVSTANLIQTNYYIAHSHAAEMIEGIDE